MSVKAHTKEKIEAILGKKIVFTKVFEADASEEKGNAFTNCSAAEKFCKEIGLSYGSMSRQEPIAVKRGDVIIPKWDNLYCESKPTLDGVLVSDSFRNDTVELWLTYDPTVEVKKPKKKSKVKSDSAFIFLGYGKEYNQHAVVFRWEVDPPTMKRKSAIRTDDEGKKYIYWSGKTIYLQAGIE